MEVRRSTRTKTVAGSLLAGLALTSCQSEISLPGIGSTDRPSVSVSVPTPDLPTELPSIDVPSVPGIDIKNLPGMAGCAPYLDTAKYANLEYEACFAYVGNSATVALQGIYKYGNSRVNYLANAARGYFESRFWEAPRQAVLTTVADWPKTIDLTGNTVEQELDVKAVEADFKANRAFVTTQETWRVKASDGEVLLDEPTRQISTTMCRVKLPGHALHEWVVAARDDARKEVDCADFAARNGLGQ